MGLLAPVERKNGWQLAEAAGDCCPDRMRRLLNNARRDPRVCVLTCGNMYSTPDDKGELEPAYYLCYGPAATTIEQLAGVAGARWAIEECFQSAKNEDGLDQYQVRRYDGWHRHITLAMLAHAYLAVTAANAPKSRRGLVPLTPAETRRLLAHLTSAA
ncbi:MAG: transposase, partial [Actinomycetia bacterium]|nr:transposase [Actinomycetes bacterium]